MATKITTRKHKLHAARQMYESISEQSNSAYYVFVGDHIPKDNSSITEISESIVETQFDPYQNMQFGKRVSANDALLTIRNIPYTSGTVYDMYDDEDDDLLDSDYYAIVNASSYYHVFKVLDNNLGANSTIEPDFSHISGSNSYVYQTSDGYRWKYMYSVTSTVKDKFSTDDWFPLQPNTTVSAQAVDGSIDIIKIDGEGAGYHNHLSGTFTASQIRYNGEPKIYRITNSSIQVTNGFYTGCMLYISSGTGSGGYSRIVDYFVNANGNFIELADELDTTPINGSQWQINPEVIVTGHGRNLVNAVARALINASSQNSVYRIEMLNRGSGYVFASANVIANSVVSVQSPAIVRPIYSPYNGHGYDAASELHAQGLMFSIKFSNSESNTIPTINKFQQVGVVKDPIFGNTRIQISSSNGAFIANETVYKINPVRVATNATINTTSSMITVSGGDFVNQFTANDYVYIKSSNGTSHMLTKVNDVVNSTVINVTSNGFFACTSALVYQANISSNAIFLAQPNSSIIELNRVQGVLQSNDIFIGNSSGGQAVVNTIIRSNVTKGFNTFIQMNKLIGTYTSGTFTADEVVYQGASLATATALGRIHSAVVDGGTLTVYITNQQGDFSTGNIVGATSLAIASISSTYKPELIEGSGEILFVENLLPVTRQNNQSETMRINFTF